MSQENRCANEKTSELLQENVTLRNALQTIIAKADAFDAAHDEDSANYPASVAVPYGVCRRIARKALSHE